MEFINFINFDHILLLIIGVIFFFAIFDLMVWVSNDAINFLSPAVWSKAWSYKTIIIVTSLWLLVWTLFSSWLMEVARKWIFHPEYFNLIEITILFLSVIVADILLLNKFNSLWLPTSTTVSIVFCLLGSAVWVWAIKIYHDPNISLTELSKYINTAKVLIIIFWIFWSVLVSFFLWWIVQYITRMFFTFDYKSKPQYWTAILAWLATTSITHFMFAKWLKWTWIEWYKEIIWAINSNLLLFILVAFIIWFIFFQILLFFKVNVFKIVVLIWTFSLAMAFAGNDLVNFIWVPLAALKSYTLFSSNTLINDPTLFLMDWLNKKEQANVLLLLMSWVIMILVIIFSKKAKKVLDTWLDLSRQDGGEEKFGSSYISKVIVRKFILLLKTTEKIVPKNIWNYVWNRFIKIKSKKKDNSFDLVRASVILICSSILISIATSYKLPLSTTYVTFMVSMGAAFADRAWGRESAVYRVNWVISVIWGWFLTAFGAFTFSFIISNTIYFWWPIIAILVIMFTILVMLKPLFKKKKELDEDKITYKMHNFNIFSSRFFPIVKDNLYLWKKYFSKIITSLWNEDIKEIKKINNNILDFKINIYDFKKSILLKLWDLKDKKVKYISTYIWILNSFKNYSKSLLLISEQTKQYIDNNHVFSSIELENLKKLNSKFIKVYRILFDKIEKRDFKTEFSELEEFLLEIDKYVEDDLEKVKQWKIEVQSSIFYINILNEIRYILLEMKSIYKRCWKIKVKK